VLEYLEAENRFTQGSTKHTAALREQLYNEFLGHMKETDDTVPYRHGPYLVSCQQHTVLVVLAC
jgi:oligopeptidase B